MWSAFSRAAGAAPPSDHGNHGSPSPQLSHDADFLPVQPQDSIASSLPDLPGGKGGSPTKKSGKNDNNSLVAAGTNAIARGTYFIRNKFLANTSLTEFAGGAEREVPEGYATEDYDINFVVSAVENVSKLYHAQYLPLGHDCSMLKVYPNAVPRGMDVYSLLSTMYNSKFSVFLPQFGCDFLDANDCSYAIILEPCYPGYTPLKKFVSEFSELANAELKCRLLARIFAKLFAFVKLSHEEECMGWFDYETLFLEAGYENLKFFHLGFHHDPNKTRQQKIVADYRQCARVLDVVLQVQDAAGGPVPETSRDDHKNSPTMHDMIVGGAGGDNAKLRSKMMNLRQQPGALPSGYNQMGSMVISQEQIYDENYNDGIGSGEQAQDAEQHEMALEGQEYYYQDKQVAHEDANVNEQDFYSYQYAAYHLQHDALSAGAAVAQGDYESGGNEVFLNNYNVEGGHRQEPPSSLPDVGSRSKNNELLLQTCRSLRDFRETLHRMTHLDEAISHPFLVEYEAKNRIDLLHKLFGRNGGDFHLSGNLCDAASIMAALQRLEQTSGAGGGNGTNGNAGGRKTTTMLKTRTTTTMLSGRKSEAAAATQGEAGGVPRQMTSSRKALGGIVGSLSGTSEDMGGKHKPTHSEPGMVTRMMSRTTTGAS